MKVMTKRVCSECGVRHDSTALLADLRDAYSMLSDRGKLAVKADLLTARAYVEVLRTATRT